MNSTGVGIILSVFGSCVGYPMSLAAVALAVTLFFAGASVAIAEEKPMSLTITSTAFAPGGPIPSLYTFRPESTQAT
jgi:hypothetical protein